MGNVGKKSSTHTGKTDNVCNNSDVQNHFFFTFLSSRLCVLHYARSQLRGVKKQAKG